MFVEQLHTYLVTQFASFFPAPNSDSGAVNIFPLHIPDDMLTDANPVLTYAVTNEAVNLTQSVYTVQLNIFAKKYSDTHRLANVVRDAFRNKKLGAAGDFIATVVQEVFELDFDPDTGVYGRSIDVTVKTKSM